jgi:acetamidase/formamidase
MVKNRIFLKEEDSMQTAKRSTTYNVHSALNPPQITVKPGEVFTAETELCTGNWLNSINDTWSPEKTNASNPTVCIGVEGAKAGDMLAVEILEIIPDVIGYTGFNSGLGALPGRILPMDFGLNTKTVKIEDNIIHWSDTVKLQARPMIGTLGTAPALEALSDTKGGPHGGNMDVQEVCAGSTVYLPVAVEGALLHVGDAHALQGDGEINGAGGIECRAAVRMRAWTLPQPKNFRCVRITDAGYIMTVACGRTAEDSFHMAAGQLLAWMAEDYGCTHHEAYLLLGQVMEARATQFVNPTSTYICKIAKKYLH